MTKIQITFRNSEWSEKGAEIFVGSNSEFVLAFTKPCPW
jgi:hypothetical protein